MFETLFDTMNTAVFQFLSASYQDFGNALRPIVVALAVIYVMLQAYGYLRGTQQQGGAVEIAARGMRICLVVYFATDWTTFDTFVYSGVIHPIYSGLGSMIVKATNTLGSTGAGADYSTLGKWMDGKFKDELVHAFSLIGSLISPGSIGPIPVPWPVFSPGKVVGGICQVVGITIFFAIAFYSVLMSQLGLLLVLLFSPLFIVCYMFDTMRSFAESWLRTVIGMMLIPAFLQVAIVFCFWLADRFEKVSGGGSLFIGIDLLTGDSNSGVYVAILLALAWIGMGMFLLQIPGFVTGMVGSLAGSQPNAIVQYISDRAISAATHGGSDVAKSASSIAAQGAPSRPAGGGVPGAVQAGPSGPPGGGATGGG